MRVGLHRENFHVDRQDKAVGQHVARVTWGDVDALTSEPEHGRDALGRIAAEVHTNGRLHHLGPPGLLEMEFHHQVGAGLERPRQAFGQ